MARPLLFTLTLLLPLLSTGCNGEPSDQLERKYGSHGSLERVTLDGLGILAGMFKQEGYKVSRWRRMSPLLKASDVIVWAPTDYSLPDQEQQKFIGDWLSEGSGRTLVFIGRDYNAEVDYWQAIRQGAPPEQAEEIARRLAKAQVRDSLERPPLTAIEACRWFVRRPGKQRDVKQLRGPWSFSISPTKTDIELRSYFDELTEADIPPEEYEYWLPETEVLLAAGDGSPLMMRVTQLDWSDSQILVVSNGSFLLNYPLVNHEHRKLAGMLIDQCGGGDGRTAIFLEGATSEVAVRESEPSAQDKISSAMLRQWPLNVILLHLIVLGIIYCIARSPIFGRPREAPAASTTDFAAHIDALGRQLSRTRDSAYAQERVEHFRQLMRRE